MEMHKCVVVIFLAAISHVALCQDLNLSKQKNIILTSEEAAPFLSSIGSPFGSCTPDKFTCKSVSGPKFILSKDDSGNDVKLFCESLIKQKIPCTQMSSNSATSQTVNCKLRSSKAKKGYLFENPLEIKSQVTGKNGKITEQRSTLYQVSTYIPKLGRCELDTTAAKFLVKVIDEGN